MRARVGALVVLMAAAGCGGGDGDAGSCKNPIEIDFPCTGTSACVNGTQIQRCGTASCWDLGYTCCEGATCISRPLETCPSGTVCMERVWDSKREVEAACVSAPDGGATGPRDGGWHPPPDATSTCGIPRYQDQYDAALGGQDDAAPADAPADAGTD
jgi:hypothetical protein